MERRTKGSIGRTKASISKQKKVLTLNLQQRMSIYAIIRTCKRMDTKVHSDFYHSS